MEHVLDALRTLPDEDAAVVLRAMRDGRDLSAVQELVRERTLRDRGAPSGSSSK